MTSIARAAVWNGLALVLAIVLALGALFGARPALAGQFALIVTNNRSLDLERPDLHYADDDGAKWAELFGDLIGPERVTLLTELDADSRGLFLALAPTLAPPTRAALDAAAARLARVLAQDDGPDVVYLVFAGHGDLADGEGFLELADQRFSASDLERLVAGLGADRVHLVLDACNAFFMLHPRKPGGARYTQRVTTADLLQRHPEVGALVSTSAEAIAWEWSEIQSGIFSHLVRSALRGAADADRDGAIGYAELEGYLAIAQADLANAEYRPRIFARAPAVAASEPFVRLPQAGGATRRVAVELATARRFTLRDERGLRVLDAHLEAGAELPLVLPAGPLEVDERIAAEPRPRQVSIALPADARRLAAPGADARTDTVARGEAPVFRKLFTTAFGPAALARWATTPRVEEPGYGVTRRDADRLGQLLKTASAYERHGRVRGAIVSGGLAVGFLGVSSALVREESPIVKFAGLGLGVAGIASIVDCAADVFVSEDIEDVAADYAALDLSSEDARAQAVIRYEALLRAEVRDARSARIVSGGLHLVLGLGTLGVASWAIAGGGGREFTTGILAGIGVGYLASGIYQAFAGTSSLEDLWRLYRHERQLPWEPGAPAAPAPSTALTPVFAPIDGGLVLGVGGGF